MLDAPMPYTSSASLAGFAAALNPPAMPGGEGMQFTDLTGSKFLELYLVRLLPLHELPETGTVHPPARSGELLPDGNTLPHLFADLIPVDANHTGAEPAVNPLLAMLFRQFDAAGEIESGHDFPPVPGNYAADKSNMPGIPKPVLSEMLKHVTAAVHDQPDLQNQSDPAKMQLLFDRAGLREFTQVTGTETLVQDRTAVTGVSPQDNTVVRVSPQQQTVMPRIFIDTPVDHKLWGQALAARVSILIANNQHTAQININPPELGPIEVRVTMKHDHANINFFACHGDVRDAITDALPRLRDMLNQNGMTLGESNVFERPLAQGQDNKYSYDDDVAGPAPLTHPHPADDPVNTVTRLMRIGMVDYYV